MRTLSILLTWFILGASFAQTNDKDAIMKVVSNVFEAMRTSDSTLLKSCFTESPNFFTVYRTKDGETKFVQDDFNKFVNAVGQPKEEIWDEPIWNEKVKIDDDLASVWVDYAFYLGDQFSHCGVDAFQLVRLEGNWKIFHLTDTRRRNGCEVPEGMIPNNKAVTTISTADQLVPAGLSITNLAFKGRDAFAVTTSEGNGGDGFASIKDLTFTNGTIEAELIGLPKESGPATARGFVGIAFRIGEDQKYECIYIRPTNARANNMLRRNHSLQYVSHPDYPWHRLRKEQPGMYESYVDMELGEWTKLRIEVEGEMAKLFVNNSAQPVLIVNDLKLGKDRSGGVGFWTFSTTDAYFANVKVTVKD